MPVAPFNFMNRTRILFGSGMIQKLSEYLPEDKVFMICYGGGNIKSNGVYDAVMKTLGSRKHEEFSGIEANPDFDTLIKCVERCKALGPENVYLLAVGGGSVIDGVKFIAAASAWPGDAWKLLQSAGKSVTSALPIATVLTLPATGSESNEGSVVSCRRLKRKMGFMSEHLFPLVSVLDPDYMLTLPDRQIKNGVVDAFVHVCEQYITYPEDADCQDRYSEGLLKTLLVNGERIMKDKSDYVARSNVMWAANQALNTLLKSGVPQDWATHFIGHELTANLGLDHGQTLAIVQPRLLELKFAAKRDKLAMMGRNVFGLSGASDDDIARETIVRIEKFYRETMKVPTKISECECSQDKSWIDEVCARFHTDKVMLGERNDISSEDTKTILYRCY